jgi:hypothetical protein
MGAVRKRIVIGLLILSVIGTAVFFFSQPKRGSVEWHKREYLAAMDRAAERTWRNKLRRVYARITGTKVVGMTQSERSALLERLKQHENYLVALGFLQAKEIPHEGFDIVLKDGTRIEGLGRMYTRTHEVFDPNGLTRKHETMSPYARSIPDGLVTIAIGTADDVRKWEEMMRNEEAADREQILRKYNVPKNEK